MLSFHSYSIAIQGTMPKNIAYDNIRHRARQQRHKSFYCASRIGSPILGAMRLLQHDSDFVPYLCHRRIPAATNVQRLPALSLTIACHAGFGAAPASCGFGAK